MFILQQAKEPGINSVHKKSHLCKCYFFAHTGVQFRSKNHPFVVVTPVIFFNGQLRKSDKWHTDAEDHADLQITATTLSLP